MAFIDNYENKKTIYLCVCKDLKSLIIFPIEICNPGKF